MSSLLTSTAGCNTLASTILSGTTNLAARAGMMCSQLQLCPAAGCSSLTSTKIGSGTALSGALDLCAAEGVAGGTPTPLPSATRGPANCRTASECSGPGMMCIFPPSPPQVCECSAGSDLCYGLGNCTSFCSLNSTLDTVAALNAGTKTCDVVQAGAGVCSTTEVCTAVSGCQEWVCDTATQSLKQVPCTGLCKPQQLSVTGAALSDDGTTVTAALSASASSFDLQPCPSVLDTGSALAVGGAGASCSASGSNLVVRLGPAATLQANQVLTLLSGADQKLRGQLDPTQPFTGSFNVSWCSACAVPRAAVIGPPIVTEVCEGVSSLLAAANAAPALFDASLSVDPSGHAQWSNVQWAVPASAPGSAASKAVLQAAVDRTNALPTVRERLALTLTNAEVGSLELAPAYTLQVTVTSWLSTSATTTATFARASTNSAPTVTVLGASSQPFRIIDGLGAGAQAGAVCKGKSLEWRWNSTWPGLPAGGVAGQTLWLQGPVPAVNGQSIPLVVTANYVGDTSTAASSAVTMVAVGSNPVAVLAGPAGDIPDNEPIVLKAIASTDPDTTPALQRLSFRWTCRREDFPAPCFTGASQGDQDSVPGVWTLPASLLAVGKTHVFTVTVVKDTAAGSTASPLSASQSLSLRPRSTAVPFPRGNLTRQCAAAGCSSPHPTDAPLTVMLTIATEFVASTVSWASADASGVAGLTAASAANTPGMPPGVHTLTVPASVLPTNRPSITITAVMTSPANVSGEATVTVPLNGAPFCSLVPTVAGASANANGVCLEVTALADTFPTAAFRIRANNWADTSAWTNINTLNYDFGIRTFIEGGAINDVMQQSSAAPSGTLVGMQQGNVTLYGCAIDPEGSRTCGTVVVTVKPPGADFNASAALSTVDVSALLESNDKRSLLQAANTAAAIMSTVNTSDPAAAELVSKQSALLVSAILSGTSMTDATQVHTHSCGAGGRRNQAVAAMSAIAASSGAALSDSSRAVFANAAKDATAALGSTAVDSSFVTQVCAMSSASLPTSNSTNMTSTSSSATGRRSRLLIAAVGGGGGGRSLLQSSSGGSANATNAQSSLADLLTVASRLAAALGRQAAPGGSYLAAGSQGVFVGAVALAAPSAGTVNASTSGLVAAGPDAAVGTAASNGTSSSNSTAAAAAAGRHRRLQELSLQHSSTGRQLLQTISASGRSGSAEAFVVLSGAIATGAGGWSLGLSYATQAISAVSSTLAGQLPATVTLLGGGLASVAWSAISTTTSSSPPALDGNTNYLLLRIPAPGYDPAKSTACLLYNASATPPTASGNLAGMPVGSSPAVFVSYDSATGRVACRAAAVGSYLVAQGPAPPSPPMQPPVADVQPPPPASNTSSIASPPPPGGSNPEAGPGDSGGGDGVNEGAIIGGVIGGVAGVALLAGAAYVGTRYQKRGRLQLVAQEGPADPDPGIGIDIGTGAMHVHDPAAAVATAGFAAPGAAGAGATAVPSAGTHSGTIVPTAAGEPLQPGSATAVAAAAAAAAASSRPTSGPVPSVPRRASGTGSAGGWTSGQLQPYDDGGAEGGGTGSPATSGRLPRPGGLSGVASISQVTPFVAMTVAQHRLSAGQLGPAGADSSGPPSSAGSHANRTAWS
ncbi:hypothetical protein HYH02_003603 [Chlamydomonas schloesseri]|uniref:PKD/REJ-like domain-containing protein n=1 Tax=Chlamydomonas schloesseri TaxID=2026947 RepID=A0A835WQ45_9CHLO|nr:hypothetical protein HYH02_003603 [Chlamydomonas schloesseri]|eukprot:KAG2451827.1 hypothetical protein HYH02_003603 [Chlamydomonas schloesseri]